MLSTLVMVLVVVALGTRASDNLSLRQQEIILAKLPQPEAVAYYDVLRRRVRKIRILRAVALLSLFCIFYAYRHGQTRSGDDPAPVGPAETGRR
jgi:hypothetical protein